MSVPTPDYITPLDAYYHNSPGTISWSEATQVGPTWTISVFIRQIKYADGSGASIKVAKHDAARQAIEVLKEEGINIVVTVD